MTNFKNIISKFRGKNILVIGDIILDQYIMGAVSRISPEAPVPVVKQEYEASYTPGGSANVANNLSSLGVCVSLSGCIGSDNEGKILLKELKKRKIGTKGIFIDRKIPTALKTRIIAQHQQIVRVDREKLGDNKESFLTEKIIHYIKRNIHSFDAIIISDYGKGVITPLLVSELRALAIQGRKIITVDPKVEHFGYYQGITAITPNKKEAENAIRNIKVTHKKGSKLHVNSDKLESDADINSAGQALLKFLELDALLLTLGEHGVRLFEKGRKPSHINTRAKEVFDVTGAGDTVIAVFTLSLACGANKHDAADLSNFAAGIVVGKMGAVTVTRKDLLNVIQHK